VWNELKQVAGEGHEEWKRLNPTKKLDDAKFLTTAEVYGYSLDDGLEFPIGDQTINYFANGFDSLINFGFKTDVKKDYEALFSSYSAKLNGVRSEERRVGKEWRSRGWTEY